jgi:DNA-binding CsgD family transcriptional regulator
MPLTVPGPNTGYATPAITLPAVARIYGGMDYLEEAEAAARTALASPSVTPAIESRARAGTGGNAAAGRDGCRRAVPRPEAVAGHADILGHPFYGPPPGIAGLYHRKAGYRLELAWTCHDYAKTLLVGARHAVPLPDARARAMSLLDDALAISTELGMKPLMERVQALQQKAAAQPAPTPAYPDRLTEREVEVLRLIAAGKSNREIAQELSISLKMVARHISNIFAKTSVANRTEAAAYAARHELVSW